MFTASPDDRFRWHPEARLFGPDGAEQDRVRPGRESVIPDRPAARALAEALALAETGRAFRIGGGHDAPETANPPHFETLTSGSTGTPRRIRRSQQSWTASFRVNRDLFGLAPHMRLAVLGRLVQSLSLYGALEGMHGGAEVHVLDGLRPDRQAAALRRLGVQLLYATPAQLRPMLDAPPVPSMRAVLIGGSKLDRVTRAGLTRLFPDAALREFYGAAEASFITLADAETPEGSVGRPYPGVEIALRGSGEIWVRSPYLFAGYGAAVTGGALWRDGWLSVGEIGHWAGPHLCLSGRAGRMLTVADQNVFPEEIEAFLLSLPGVLQAAVIARPDRARGHVIEAAIAGPADPGVVLAAARAELGPLKAPRRVHLLPDWPLLASGKTDLAALERALL